LPPIAQDQSYHDFADQRTILGIPHFWHVVSTCLSSQRVSAGFIAMRRPSRFSSGYC
jgi:hypothetical protein